MSRTIESVPSNLQWASFYILSLLNKYFPLQEDEILEIQCFLGISFRNEQSAWMINILQLIRYNAVWKLLDQDLNQWLSTWQRSVARPRSIGTSSSPRIHPSLNSLKGQWPTGKHLYLGISSFWEFSSKTLSLKWGEIKYSFIVTGLWLNTFLELS